MSLFKRKKTTPKTSRTIKPADPVHCVDHHVDADRVLTWADNAKREPAQTAFTEGPGRRIAQYIESLDKHFTETTRGLELQLAQEKVQHKTASREFGKEINQFEEIRDDRDELIDALVAELTKLMPHLEIIKRARAQRGTL